MFFLSFDQNEKTKNVCLCLLTWNKKKSNKPSLFFVCSFLVWNRMKKNRFAEKENVGKKTKTSKLLRKPKNKLLKKIQHAFEESIFLSQTKGICNRRERFFFFHFGRNQRVGNNKRTKKKEFVCFFFCFKSASKAKRFLFFHFGQN